MSSHSSILQLECDTKSDPWGRVGAYSLAARFAQAASGATFRYKASEPYSEMWMGTYPSLPSRLLSNGEELQKHLDENAERLIGEKVLNKFGKDLPFIPKILSIAKVRAIKVEIEEHKTNKQPRRCPSKSTLTKTSPPSCTRRIRKSSPTAIISRRLPLP